MWWLIAAAAGPNAYAVGAMVHGDAARAADPVRLHLGADPPHAGRHQALVWDLGYGFGPVEREWLTVATLVGSIGFTVLIWIVGYLVMGGIR